MTEEEARAVRVIMENNITTVARAEIFCLVLNQACATHVFQVSPMAAGGWFLVTTGRTPETPEEPQL